MTSGRCCSRTPARGDGLDRFVRRDHHPHHADAIEQLHQIRTGLLFPGDADARSIRFDAIANVALYVPLGLVLRSRTKSGGVVALTGMAFSCATELLQFAIPGRDPSFRDILANTLGSFAGAQLLMTPMGPAIERRFASAGQGIARLVNADGSLARACFSAWTMVVAVTLILTAVLLFPVPPPGDRYFLWSPLVERATGPLRIGGNTDPAGFFRGLIDEVRIYARAQPQEQIQADMAGTQAGETVSTRGLVASYSFDEGTGTIAHDASGHGNDGLISGASWVTEGRTGSALSFDGRSSIVTVQGSSELDLSDGMTLEAWVKPFEQPEVRTTIIAHENETYFLRGSLQRDRLSVAAGGRFGNTNNRARFTSLRKDGEWTYLAATYDREAIRIYVNGILEVNQVRWSDHQPAGVSLHPLGRPFGPIVPREQVWSVFSGPIDLHATVHCGEEQARPAPVFMIVAPGSVNTIGLIADRADLLIRTSTRARRIGLLSPDYRVPGVFGDCAEGRTVDVAIGGRFQDPTATVDGRTSRVTGSGIGSAWAFVIHSDLLPGSLDTALTSLWLAALFLPWGFWMRRDVLALASGLAILAAIWLTSHTWHIQPVDSVQAASMLAGVLSGFACRASLRGRGYRPRLSTTV